MRSSVVVTVVLPSYGKENFSSCWRYRRLNRSKCIGKHREGGIFSSGKENRTRGGYDCVESVRGNDRCSYRLPVLK